MNKIRLHSFKNSIGFVLFLFAIQGYSQKPIGNEEPEVKVIATATKNSIMLRWAVNTPTTWTYANKYGFLIVRKTITRGGQILKTPEVVQLTKTPILPKPMMEWEQFTEENTNAAIAAQALYGESFKVDLENGGNTMVSIVNQASALEQRFSFALFAADQDFKVAEFSGLAYIDSSVVPGEQYLYTIATAIPTEKMQVKSGGAYLGLQDYQPLPEPLDFNGIFNDKMVMLSWNFQLLKRTYNNYIVERSDDNGATFLQLDDVPLANMGEKEKNPSDRMFYTDSLPQNNKEYQYRIKGISPFGQVGPVSQVIKGSGSKALTYNPAITHVDLSEDESSALITWNFPAEGMETLSHFELNRSARVKEGYQVIQPNISKDQREIRIKELTTTAYYTLTAIGLDGSKRVSFPKMIQLDDNTPPEIPIEISGVIDSTGVVRLQWKQNTESDFLGYRVFRANLENEEFTQVTFKPLPVSVYTDTINIKTLNSKIHYKIRAYDKRYNPSDFSEILTLQKPDIIPPTAPVITSFEVNEDSVELQWVSSRSEDAAKTLIYRKQKGKEEEWILVGEFAIGNNDFQDKTILPETTYLYTLLTIDTSGLESNPITPLTVTTAKGKILGIERFIATVNIEAQNIRLSWKYNKAKVLEYTLYKASEGEPLTMYKTFKPNIENFTDTQLQINTTYQYGIRALLNNGAKTPIKKISVAY